MIHQDPIFLITFLSTMQIEIALRMRHTIIFLGTEVRLTGSWFPGSFFLLTQKLG